jgi:ubiquinone/menaquinone biosynthesis C-methylase UbiE
MAFRSAPHVEHEVKTDRDIERERYDGSAQLELRESNLELHSSASIAQYLRTPYTAYEETIARIGKPGMKVLELGSGTGRHSLALAASGMTLTCSDIASRALEVLVSRAERAGFDATVVCTPMETMPFPESSFDVVASAGSLSYADPQRLDVEIERVLKPGGSFICIDSLNHNPIYRLNRWIHWRLRGDRTLSTCVRMPTIKRMACLGSRFQTWSIRGFGAYSWLWAPLARAVGEGTAARCNDAFDLLPGSQRLAFKFVFEAHGLRKDAPAATAITQDQDARVQR